MYGADLMMDYFAKEQSIRQFVSDVSDQHHPMTGAVIAVAAAQAAALGEACMQISLDNQVDKLNWQDVTRRIERIAGVEEKLLEWGELEARATTSLTALWKGEEGTKNQQFWCESAAEISRLAINAAILLQDFRPLAFKTVRDDLEIALAFLVSMARTALLLLDSNLQIWHNSMLHQEFEPIQVELESQINLITPVTRFSQG